MATRTSNSQKEFLGADKWEEAFSIVKNLQSQISQQKQKLPQEIRDSIDKLESILGSGRLHLNKKWVPLAESGSNWSETKEDLIELETETMDSWIVASASEAGLNIDSPGRQLTDNLHKLKETINKSKTFIDLSIGDPTHYANDDNAYLLPNSIVIEAMKSIVKNGEYNGYGPSHGHVIAREALLEKYKSKNVCDMSINDIFITSACTDALNIAISSVGNPNDIVLLPKPGIGRFTTICKRFGIIAKYYNLIIDDKIEGGGKIDLNDLETKLKQLTLETKQRVKAILINNPSNPAGSVFSESNLRGVLSIAEKYEIPIISDEIYDHIVFNDAKFQCLGSLTTKAPVLVAGGISKTYLVPGWRMGWLLLYDPKNIGVKIRKSISNLMTANPSQNTLSQAIIPQILNQVPKSYYINLNKQLQLNAMRFYNGFKKIKQLTPIKPHGAMYILTKLELNMFDSKYIANDIDFMYKLLEEESIFVFCGSIFGLPNHFRTLILPPTNIIDQVIARMQSFCNKYSIDNHKAVAKL